MVKRRREPTPYTASEKLNGNGMTSGTASGADTGQNGREAVEEEQCASELVSGERSTLEIGSTKQQPTAVVQTNNLVLRSSTRPSKRPKRDNSPPASFTTSSKPSVSYKSSSSNSKSNNNAKPKKRLKRLKTLKEKRWRWTVLDSNLFFEALYEHGKNFDLIHKFIEQRHKKRGVPANITKEQVRHLYYRMLHKISKYFPKKEEDQKKIHQEICGLINYGELKKKLKGALDEKKGRKLTELMSTGYIKIGENAVYLQLEIVYLL